MDRVDEDFVYKIGDVVRLTGVPAGTIRFWESRHRLVVPERSRGGFRLYSAADVETIRGIRRRYGVRLRQVLLDQPPGPLASTAPSTRGGLLLVEGHDGVGSSPFVVSSHEPSTHREDRLAGRTDAGVTLSPLEVLIDLLGRVVAGDGGPVILAQLVELARIGLLARWCALMTRDPRDWIFSTGITEREAEHLRGCSLFSDRTCWSGACPGSLFTVVIPPYPWNSHATMAHPELRFRLVPIVGSDGVSASLCIDDGLEGAGLDAEQTQFLAMLTHTAAACLELLRLRGAAQRDANEGVRGVSAEGILVKRVKDAPVESTMFAGSAASGARRAGEKQTRWRGNSRLQRQRPRTGRGRGPIPAGQPRDNLTAREIEILQLLAMGKSSKEIAPLLDIADKTVRNHLSNIYRKLHVYDRVQALLLGVKSGLVTLGRDQEN